MANPNQDARGVGTGRYERTLDSATRDGQAARLREQRMTYKRIADELGYSDKGSAWRGVQRARVAVLKEPAEALVRAEAAQLDELYVEALEVLERDHITVSNGKVITLPDENGTEKPLLDDGPKLAAIRELRAIRESYRKLYGLDQPGKVEMSGGVKYEVVGVSPEDLV